METFDIQAYSSPHTNSLWANHWICTGCGFDHNEDSWAEVEASSSEPICPLHNPLYCSGTLSGDKHVVMPCRPYGEVFQLNIKTRERTVIGKVK